MNMGLGYHGAQTCVRASAELARDDAMSSYPQIRMRRLRRHDWTRRLVAENTLSPADFIWPVFVIDGDNKREPVASMPGVERLSIDLVVAAAKEAARAGHSGDRAVSRRRRPR